MIVGTGCVSIKIRPLANAKNRSINSYCCVKGKKNDARAPPEALQSPNPSMRIRLVRIGLRNLTLSKQVYLHKQGFASRVEEKRNERNTYPRASA
jgi:hypothetical protein